MENKALILFGHGSRDPEWAATLDRICHSVKERSPETRVETAYLEFTAPSLPESVARLAGEAYRRIVVVPVFLARGGHLKHDLPMLMAELRQAHAQVDFELSPPLGEVDSVIEAMAAHVLTLR